MKICEKIIENANKLARKFYLAYGNKVEKGYRFDKANHPQEKGMWDLAVIAYEFIDGTEVEEALEETQNV